MEKKCKNCRVFCAWPNDKDGDGDCYLTMDLFGETAWVNGEWEGCIDWKAKNEYLDNNSAEMPKKDN